MRLRLDGQGEDLARIRRTLQQLSEQAGPIVAIEHVNTADSSAIAGTAAETNFSLSYVLPANSLRAGTRLGIFASGVIEAAVSCNVRFKVKAGNVALLDTGDLTLTAPLVGAAWTIEAEAVCRQIGAAGELMTALRYGQVHANMISIAPTLASVDLSEDQTIQLSATFSVSDAGNTTTQKLFRVDVGN